MRAPGAKISASLFQSGRSPGSKQTDWYIAAMMASRSFMRSLSLKRFRDQLVRQLPRRVISGDGNDHHFFGHVLRIHRFDAGTYRVRRSDDPAPSRRQPAHRQTFLFEEAKSLLGRRNGDQLSAPQKGEHHP